MSLIRHVLPGAAALCVVAPCARAQVTVRSDQPVVGLAPGVAPEDGLAVEQVVVRARRLSAARSALQPALGATSYRFSEQALRDVPQGSNAPLSQVLLQAPGVAEDSYGQLHVRGDHNEVQYRLDGVQLPEGVSVFGQALEARFAHAVSFITGSLPAQYGQLQAAVVDITTRTGITNPGGEASFYGGARDYFQPSLSYGGRAGDWDYYATGDFLHSRLGIENPTSGFTAVHDLSNQYHGLLHLNFTPDDATRLSLIAGASNSQFQIPNNPGQVAGLGLNVDGVTQVDSAGLTEHQREITDFAILSLQKHFGNIDAQTSLFSRCSSLYFTPDPVGDLLFNGLAQTAGKSVWSSGVQNDASWHVAADHTIRAGFQITGERLVSDTRSSLFFLDGWGAQTSPLPSVLAGSVGKTGGVYGVYLQDEWKLLPGLTLNYGGRFDAVDEFTHESQFSPRVNLVWQPAAATTLHAGYAHYFTPPPFELIQTNAVTQFDGTTSQSPCQPGSNPLCRNDVVRAEHDHYFDMGVDHVFLPWLRAGVDAYFKSARNLIDEGQFGAPIILTVFNYARGQAGGVEFSASYDRGPWSFYGNLAISRAIGRQIDSAQFTFSPDDLAYIGRHYIHLDHDERFAGSAGAAYGWDWARDMPARLSADLVTGSGLRADGAVPNGSALPGYYVINLAFSQTFKPPFLCGTELRFDITNLLDRRYEIRDGSGIGVGAPQYGMRRTLLVGVTQHF